MIKIKDFSEKTDFSIRMLRYLEDLKLLIPERADNNYRHYNPEQINEAIKIKKLQNLGFQLNEILNILKSNWAEQLIILENVLEREIEISEIKSETIPRLRSMINEIKKNKVDLISTLDQKVDTERIVAIRDNDTKFQRTAYSIPVLRTIYEDYLEEGAQINCLETDVMKFGHWLNECKETPEVYSIFNASAFSFGINLTDQFIHKYKEAWSKFLPYGEMTPIADFSIDDLKQLMGHHDLIIKTKFEYRDNGQLGEIIIPYTPIYTMTRISNKQALTAAP